MIKHYIKIAWRSIWNAKSYTLINILGLAAGLASFILVLSYLNYELSYDTWSPELEKVYRVSMKQKEDLFEATPAPLASFLAENYPKVEVATSLQGAGDYEVPISAGNETLYHNGFTSSDSLFLKVFPYKLEQGDRNTALNNPNSAIISTELAKKLFGNKDPMGRTVTIFNMLEAVITGVMKMPDTPSHRKVHLVMRDPNESQNFFWNNYSYESYIKLKVPVTKEVLEGDINRIFKERRLKVENWQDEDLASGNHPVLYVDAVPDIQNFPTYGNGSIKTVTVLFILAMLLLIIGAINFSNLSVAKSLGKTKEIGVRKVLGSGNWNLFWQFMWEAILQCSISIVIAIGLVIAILPYVNNSFGLGLQIHSNLEFLFQIGLCLIAVILISGFFPSFLLSRFKLLKILSGGTFSGNKGLWLRNLLVIFQFTVTCFFIISISVIDKQLNYLQTKDKGFSEEQLISIRSSQDTREKNFEKVRQQLLEIPGVKSVSKTTNVPGDILADSSTVNFRLNGTDYRMNSVKVSSGYFETLDSPIISGRNFRDSGMDQHTKTAIINATAAKIFGLQEPIGETIYYSNCLEKPIKIVGIVRDFNVLGYETRVQPAVFTINNEACMYQSGGAILARLEAEDPMSTIQKIDQLWKELEPGSPIRYSFLDENFQRKFASYYRIQKVIGFFGMIAIVISLMGLFALTTFALKNRIKEIGIRKVLGAEVPNIVSLVSKDFLLLVLVAVLISIPIGWYAMNKWLENFAYQTTLNWWIFLASGGLVLLIAFLTVSLKTTQAAMKNPVKSLKTE
ncbi:ABC transporter permease [Gramella sp. GC03-9]|uniref:ABC transporter permease n=1 Tax=Christiangramia oceanisediminis TaxID=2920386 RepID=A0A9X2KZP8_9FLAO|nr:ABC transporter permease [Gramella oceanisediminis]MCP9201270.1 ABC transporter permease [Gramella oceanisediminis]